MLNPNKKQDYVVRFYCSTCHQKLFIARHEVFKKQKNFNSQKLKLNLFGFLSLAPTSQDPKRRYLFSTIRQDDLEVAPGRHARWPTFDLVILPLYSPLQNYWCELTTGRWNPDQKEKEPRQAATGANAAPLQFD